ncbi:MAG: prephenate dehydrogenase/arogenate dehydrogenase family protein, partial [Clostridia bacterium]|nr:prephenate dehydrogenase/arogenate dehydrogenase family protein [Clostridia bacterium]
MERLKKIGIIGLGLIGGSIARALKRQGSAGYHIAAWDMNQEAVLQALKDGVVDRSAPSPRMGFEDRELVILGIPVFAMKSILEDLVHALPITCLL